MTVPEVPRRFVGARARRFLVCLALGSVAAVVVVGSIAPFPVCFAQQAPPKRDGGADTPLMTEMKRIDAAMQFLKRSVRDAAQDAKSLEQVVLAEQACLAAKSLTPKMTPHVAEAERAKFVAKYRKGMAQLLVEFAGLETALLDGDHERAKAQWGRLDEMAQQGHDTFTEGE